MSKLIPGKPVPNLKVRTVDGEDWNVTLYGSIVNTMPFARPPIKEVLQSIISINKSNYPARGEA
ncbi:MAG: hypothetical protein E3J58_03435 [Actinomycetota bacterium]|nr:MAG: hypothetical protein E3J58_03435 [Actinomycetota bacterium]